MWLVKNTIVHGDKTHVCQIYLCFEDASNGVDVLKQKVVDAVNLAIQRLLIRYSANGYDGIKNKVREGGDQLKSQNQNYL